MLASRDEARSKIIEIARDIFTHFGFKKTTMEEIAAASRKGKSSIYYYFNSKEDVFKAVVEKEADELKAELAEKVLVIEDPMERLKEYISFRMKKLKQLSNFYAALKSEYLSYLDFIEKIRKTYDNEEIAIVKRILEDGIYKGKFLIEDPGLSALAIVTAMKGLEVPLLLTDKNVDVDGCIDHLINMLYYGMVKR